MIPVRNGRIAMFEKHLDKIRQKLSKAKDIFSGEVDIGSSEILNDLSDDVIDSDEIDEENRFYIEKFHNYKYTYLLANRIFSEF